MDITHIYIICGAVVAIIVVAVSQKANFKWGGLILKSDNRYRKNKTVLKGNKNKITQGSGKSQNTSENELDVDGDKNELTQG